MTDMVALPNVNLDNAQAPTVVQPQKEIEYEALRVAHSLDNPDTRPLHDGGHAEAVGAAE